MRLSVACLLYLLVSVPAAAASLDGRVIDAAGAPVAGAAVRAQGEVSREAFTARDGTFSFGDLPAGSYDVSAVLDGFAPWHARVAVGRDAPPSLQVRLVPRPVSDRVLVTASRGAARESDPAAPISVLSSSELALAPSPVLDDALRLTPGFSLFRRTSSRTANPTTQGATLRGLAASGASRALVLADGVALNDPFGGWVYWNRVPQAAVERVEVVRGAASDLYGADALGGVVQVLTTEPAAGRAATRIALDGDTSATARSSLFAATRRAAWNGTASGEASRTDGTFVLDDDTRGAVDRRAGGDYLTGQAGGGVEGKGWRARLHGLAFGESRRNGTALQANDTSVRQAAGDIAGQAGPGFLEASGTAGDQTYHQSFTAVSADRASETLTSRQTAPTTFVRGAIQYRVPIGVADLLGGFDSREAWATNQDVSYFPSGAVRATTTLPGYDYAQGLYAQLRTPLGSRASVTAGIRNDWWHRERDGDAVSVASPRISASFHLTEHLVARGSVGRAFRAPTINERIRPFRVGNTLTLANPDLLPERLTLGEAGLAAEGARGSVRASLFTSVVHDAVTNVTLTSTPVLITRQRQNAAGVRANGAEAEGDWRLATPLWLTGSLALTHSTYRDTPGLSGNDVPQVPRWQATLGARWLAPSAVTLQAFVRGLGAQYEDDRNTLVLRQATLVDVSASRPVGARVSLLAAAENLFDVDYDTGRTPTRTIGTPLTVRMAVRITY